MKHIIFLILSLFLVQALGQNRPVFKQSYRLQPDGSEYLESEEHFTFGSNGDTLRWEELNYTHFEGQDLLIRRRVFETFADSTVDSQIQYFLERTPEPFFQERCEQRQVYFPADSTTKYAYTCWIYNESLKVVPAYRSEQIHSPLLQQFSDYEYNQESESWIKRGENITETRIDYDNKGCILSKRTFSAQRLILSHEYTRDENCDIIQEIRGEFDWQNIVMVYDTLAYSDEGETRVIENISERIFKEILDKETGQLIEKWEENEGFVYYTQFFRQIDRDTVITEQVVRRRDITSQNWQKWQNTLLKTLGNRYYYDHKKLDWSAELLSWDRITHQSYINNEEGDRIHQLLYGFFYDTQQKQLVMRYGVERNYRYDNSYYCDNLLKEKITISNVFSAGILEATHRTIYGYSDRASCGETADAITLFPNPVNSGQAIHIESAGLELGAHIRLIDMQGKVIATYNNPGRLPELKFNTSNLSPGIYGLMLFQEDGWKMVNKLVVR